MSVAAAAITPAEAQFPSILLGLARAASAGDGAKARALQHRYLIFVVPPPFFCRERVGPVRCVRRMRSLDCGNRVPLDHTWTPALSTDRRAFVPAQPPFDWHLAKRHRHPLIASSENRSMGGIG